MLAGRKGARVYLWLPRAPKEVARRSGQSSRMEEEDGSFFLCSWELCHDLLYFLFGPFIIFEVV